MTDQERLKAIYHYDPETGVFTWRVTNHKHQAGAVAGTRGNEGRLMLRFDSRRQHYASRLAWLYMTGEWPEHEVDHRDVDPTNDRWENLRAATPSQNKCNRRLRKNSRSGVKGVNFNKKTGKWVARVSHEGTTHYLGLFTDKEAAADAADLKRRELHGEFYRPTG